MFYLWKKIEQFLLRKTSFSISRANMSCCICDWVKGQICVQVDGEVMMEWIDGPVDRQTDR